jgi:MerR family mercuric resistance operon transcriptional regulator
VTVRVGRLRIGDLAREAGCRTETIRYYERIGLLRRPARTGAGYRAYDASDMKRLRFIRRARQLGFTTEEVRELLRLADSGGDHCADVQDLATGHLRAVHARIAALQRLAATLDEMTSRCGQGDRPACPIVESLFEDGDIQPQ